MSRASRRWPAPARCGWPSRRRRRPSRCRGGSIALGQPPSGWLRLASALPLMLLVLGLVLIQHLHDQAEIHAAAEVDAALLADDLPPEAYGDPGFVAFLKQPEQ